MPQGNYVVVEDLGLGTLAEDVERLCVDVVRKAALDVMGQMQDNISGYGTTDAFLDTGTTANTVRIDAPDPLTREIGPTTEYAIHGELGWTQHKAWGRKLKNGPIVHRPIGFAKAAMQSVAPGFRAAIRAAIQKLGRG